MVGADLPKDIAPTAEPAVFRAEGVLIPADLTLRPFTFQHDRNTAVYFRRFSATQWQQEQAKYKTAQTRLRDLQERSADVVNLGEVQAERDHLLEAKMSYPVVYRGHGGRDARSGGFFECTLKTRPGPLTLQATYWGEERDRRFTILADGVMVARQELSGDRPGEFFERDYPIPETLTKDKASLRIRFEPQNGASAGPVFGLRLYAAGGD
jgi:uncharacterized protein